MFVRDFQWKTFSPMQLNGRLGANEKFHAYGEPAIVPCKTDVLGSWNPESDAWLLRWGFAKEADECLFIRAGMFLDYPQCLYAWNGYQYQYIKVMDFLLWGPSLSGNPGWLAVVMISATVLRSARYAPGLIICVRREVYEGNCVSQQLRILPFETSRICEEWFHHSDDQPS